MERRKADLWMTEYQTPNLRLGLRTRSVLRNLQTPYQHLLVVDTEQYGKVLALDGAIQVTEKDEFTYHEMITHVALCSHPKPVEVLVIGGGDGGSIREILKHQSVKRAVLVDIDEEVIKASRDFFPSLSCSLDDPRVEVRPMDALEYIKNQKGRFDVIIVDSTDPVDFAEGLFKEPFYRDVHGALRDDGMVVAQTESPFAEQCLLTPQACGLTPSARSSTIPDYLFVKSRKEPGIIPTKSTGRLLSCQHSSRNFLNERDRIIEKFPCFQRECPWRGMDSYGSTTRSYGLQASRKPQGTGSDTC
jgi:spermidine synthase